jgi:putative alpha-1,2-mannosidase
VISLGESGALLTLSKSYLSSHSNAIQARVGVSWTSTAKACTYAESEMPSYQALADFNKFKAAAKQTWDNTLSTVTLDTTGVSKDILTDFWSAVSHIFVTFPSRY